MIEIGEIRYDRIRPAPTPEAVEHGDAGASVGGFSPPETRAAGCLGFLPATDDQNSELDKTPVISHNVKSDDGHQ